MKQQSTSEEHHLIDVEKYMRDALADERTQHSQVWQAGKIRWPSGLKVAFHISALVAPGGPVAVLGLEERWKPARPDVMLPDARKRYFAARHSAIERARDVGEQVARQFPKIPMVFTYPEPPARWKDLNEQPAR